MKISLRNVLAWLTHDDFQRILREAQTLYDNLRLKGMEVPIVTYEEAVKYFVEQRPTDARVAKGALLQEPKNSRTQLTWTFLDDKNQLLCDSTNKPYGRRLIATSLDTELMEAFGDKSLMIFQ